MKTALVTGASTGIGKQTVGELLKAGFFVYATMRNSNTRAPTFSDLKALYPNSLKVMELDVTLEKDRVAVAAEIVSLDVLVNNAGYGMFGPVEETSEANTRGILETNFFSHVFLTQALLPSIRKTKGKIFFLSSAFGFTGFPLGAMYCASKFALEGLAESLWYELQPLGVQVCIVEPGAHRTDFSKNTVWSGGEKSNSPYLRMTMGLKAMMLKMTERKTFQRPENVALRISKLARGNRIPLRVRCGADANIGHLMRKALPSFMYAATTKRAYQKMLGLH
ncbi:MAG: SDR family oxidoreductase [Bdellovibrionales bacterium]|nr:SDR family oxidoreductase [Bdellovibrionales bacterium]